ncbi:protein kinase [Actinoplanes sp. KI2]|uniref:serine/threonine-protein kinase n=1 Tax=Actinoplanes sp. KI2 TaxID=2983315 RepID=UPI0021D57924|nr:serine/threonine protein kinase [Actinoplanes sp. KI2]MCU7728790.1 protein kinase [Actinoplanes sp. KI2]
MVTVGQQVAGRYRLLRPLAAGGMGGVWLAHDEAADDLVALKKCALPDGLTPDEQDLFRVWTVREARAFAVIGHPNVVRTLDVIPSDDEPWIVMEYVPSRSLQQVIDESGALPPARVAGIGLAVLDALLAVRRAALLHLDVKPGNVLIADDGRVMLTDFGPAVTAEGVRALATAGIILGSPKYLAPERLFDGVALPESDLWSLGATLYHAVEGHPPFARDTTAATLLALTEGPPDPPVRAGALAPVIAGLLRVDPAARLAPPAVEDGLRAVLHPPADHPPADHPPADRPALPASGRPSREPAAGRPAAPRRAGRQTVTLVAALVVLIAALVTVLVVTRPGRPPTAQTPTAATQTEATPAAAPADYAWHSRPGQFRIALPRSWSVATSDPFSATGPHGAPRLSLRVAPMPANTVAMLTGEEATAGLPGYRRIRIVQEPDDVLPRQQATVWEFTYRHGGATMRAMQVVIADPAAKKIFVLDWRTPRTDWARDLTTFEQIGSTFSLLLGE